MKKHSLAAIAVSIPLLLTACGQTAEISDVSSESEFAPAVTSEATQQQETSGLAKTPLKDVTENLQDDIGRLRTSTYKNIDWSEVAGFSAPAVSECTGVKLTAYYKAHPDKTMSVQEQLSLFESYCKSYLGEFEREYACFDTAERDLLDGHYEIDGIEDIVFVAYPKLDDYMDKILDGSVVPAWYLYVDHQRQIYLWWSAQSMMYPHWFNKGETLRSLDEYYKASSAIPTDIGEPVAVYPNDGSHDSVSYRLSGGEVTIGEALDYFNNEFYSSLGVISADDVQKFAVRYIDVYQITEDTYAYGFRFSYAAGGIPLDYADEMTYNVAHGDNPYQSVTSDGKALMIKSRDIDWAVGIAPQSYVTEGEPITEIISLDKAADILSENLSEYIVYKAVSAELVMTANKTADVPDPLLLPTWKITLRNNSDGFFYDFYIDAGSGEIGYLKYNGGNNEE